MMNESSVRFSESGEIAKDIDQRVAMLRYFRDAGQLPFFRRIDAVDTPRVNVEGNDCVLLGSNSYLGLSTHPEVVAAAVKATEDFGVGTTGSRYLNGTYRMHTELERSLADWTGCQDAVLFTTGYQTNVGALQGLLGPDCLAVVDSYAHASIRDGVRLSRAVEKRFAHNDLGALSSALREHPERQFRRRMVIVDSVYSMEGSTAPLEQISAVCKEHGALLFVDEAHGIGVFGESGSGLAEHTGVREKIDIFMGSLSKSAGSLGGFIAASADIADEVRLSARAFQFSTSGTPGAIAAASAAVEIIRGAEGKERRERLERNARLMRELLLPLDVELHRPDRASPDWSPIIPIRLHDEIRTGLTWNRLKGEGVFVTPAIYPAVPLGKPILRVCMTSELTEKDVQQCAALLHAELAWAFEAA